MNPEGKSGKPPSRGKKIPRVYMHDLNNPAISEGIFSRLSVGSRQEVKQSPV